MKKFKRFIIAALLLLTVVLFVACDSEIVVYRYTDEHYNYEDIRVVMSISEEIAIENSAITDTNGKPWTLASYFEKAATLINREAGYLGSSGYTYFDRQTSTDNKKVSYYIIGKFPKIPDSSFLSSEQKYENLFIGVMTHGCDSVFKGINDHYKTGEGDNIIVSTVLGEFELPAISEAFTAIKSFTNSGLIPVTQYVGSYRKSVAEDGNKAQSVIVYGTGEATEGSFVAYNGLLGDSHDEPLKFDTTYYVSVGWFILAIAIGITTVAALIVVSRLRKKSTANAAAGEKADEQQPSEDGLIENQKINVPTIVPHPIMYNRYQNGNPYQGTPYQNSSYGNQSNSYSSDNSDPFSELRADSQNKAETLITSTATVDPFESFKKDRLDNNNKEIDSNNNINNKNDNATDSEDKGGEN